MNRGILYIVGGSKYAKWALKSIISLRQNGGNASVLPVHVHFIGDNIFATQFNNLGCTCIKHLTDKLSHHIHRKIKCLVMQDPIFDQYIMIDADTFIQRDFYDMFDQIPENGVAGIEDGNFENHLQMAKFLFLTKHAPKKDVRETVKEMLGVDYGLKGKYPPYYNVGIIGFSNQASKIIGKELYPLLEQLNLNKFYNKHDEQLPMNAIIHRKQILALSIDPIYNYTRSRMRKNKKLGIHDNIKSNIRIIHNRHYMKEADWVDTKPIELKLNNLFKNV